MAINCSENCSEWQSPSGKTGMINDYQWDMIKQHISIATTMTAAIHGDNLGHSLHQVS
jgi:hypothetical protein